MDVLNTIVRLDGSLAMTGHLKMGNHLTKNVANPVDPQDVATKAYVDAPQIVPDVTVVEKSMTPYFLKLKFGEATHRTLTFRDFFIPN